MSRVTLTRKQFVFKWVDALSTAIAIAIAIEVAIAIAILVFVVGL